MDKKEILNKMKALTSKTVDQGATEAEAMAAAQLLKTLQDKYQVTLTELDVTEAEYVEKVLKCGQTDYLRSPLHPVSHCWYDIQNFCQIKTVFSGNRVCLFGEPHNVENALYLYSLIRNSMEIEFNRYMLTSEYQYEKAFVSANSIRATFLNSMAKRIGNRLHSMHLASKNEALNNTPKASDGTSLVVVANRELQKNHKIRYPRLRRGSRSMTINSGSAKEAGRSAGDRTSLNKGVGSGSNGSTLALGRG